MRVFALVVCWCAAALMASAVPELRNGVAAIVNDSVITLHDVEDYAAEAVDVLRRTYARTQPQVFQQKRVEALMDSLEQLIEKQLILDDFKSLKAQIPQSAIDEEVNERIQRQYGDRVRLTKMLQKQGITTEAYRKRLHDDIIVNIMRQRNVSSAITISPTRIEQFYATNQNLFKVDEQVKLRMIVLNRAEGNSADELLNMAREIIRKLDEGTPFTEMASIYSQGSQRREGGDWGWIERAVLKKGLSDLAFTLQPGQRSGIVGLNSEDGNYWVYEYDKSGQVALGRKYSDKDVFAEAKRFDLSAGGEPPSPQEIYLMFVEDRRDARVRPLAEVREEIERNLIAMERGRLHKKWIDRLKAKSFVTQF
jgi:peptidyl-prolyl cis-trans isomerase SurA